MTTPRPLSRQAILQTAGLLGISAASLSSTATAAESGQAGYPFLASWFQHKDLPAISRVARDTLILVPLSLPFFRPFAFAQRLGLSFWGALAMGICIRTTIIGAWVYFSPQQ